MLLSEAKQFGVFTTRINVGQFFPRERRNGHNEKEWAKYLNSISADEFIELREPATDEVFKLRKKGTIPDGILKGVDASVAKAVIEEERDISEEVTGDMRKAVKKCVIAHSFESAPGTPATVDELWEIVAQKSSLEMAIIKAWSESYRDLASPTEENSGK